MALLTRFRREKPSALYVPASKAFKPQVKVTMTRDVNGYVNKSRGIKWHLANGKSYMVDEEKAVELIGKGYATGTPPRKISEDEKAELQAQNTVIGLG